MNAISTKWRMLSSFNIHVFTFEKAVNARMERAKDGSKSSDNLSIRRLQLKDKHIENGKLGASADNADFTFAEDYGHNDGKVGTADAYQAHNDPVHLEARSAKKPWTEDDEKYDLFSSYVTLDDASIF